MKTLITVVIVLLLIAGGAVILAYSGRVDVSATGSHSGLMQWYMETTRDSSLHARAEEIEVPALDDPQMAATGLIHYHEMCVTCHGAPGLQRSEIGKGLNPPPPDLVSHHFDDEEAAESFWVIKNGIRMTGMPAFGPTHGDDEIWAIVAFLKQLGSLSGADYAARVEAAGLAPASGGHGHGGGDHHH